MSEETSTSTSISYILEKTPQLVRKDRMGILRILVKHKLKIYEHSDGCRINLDTVPQHIVAEIRQYIFNLLQENNKVYYISD